MIGSPRVHRRVTGSTNECARELAMAGAPHGTLVTADEQTAGRGRQGRSWVAEAGDALLMSVVVRELEPRHALLPLATAVAVCEAVHEVAGARCAIKWPNDVWIERCKLAGILVEARVRERWAVVGVGINVRTREFPAELGGRATSLALQSPDVTPPSEGTGTPPSEGTRSSQTSELVLEALLPCLDRWFAATADEVIAAFRTRDALRGEKIRWGGGEGAAAGIDDSGALLVDTQDGRMALDAGEVHLRSDVCLCPPKAGDVCLSPPKAG